MGRTARKLSLRQRLASMAPKADVERNLTGLQQHTYGMVRSALTRAIVRDAVILLVALWALALHYQLEIAGFWAWCDRIGTAWGLR